MYRNQNYYLTVDILQVVCFCYATASLVVKPSNTTASEGQRVQLNCSTDLNTTISWQYIIPGESSSLPKDVFFNGQFVNGYGARYEIRDDRKKEGIYDLIIPSVQLSDTGTYRCRNDDGRLEHKDAFLSILENTDLPPDQAEVRAGEKVELICKMYFETKPVNWQHIPTGKSSLDNVFINGEFVNNYKTGYVAQINVSRAYSLTITSAKLTDSGLFRCIEQNGLRRHKDVELTVIDEVNCQMFTTDTCETSPQNVTLECNMTFYGRFAPVIQWVTAEGDVIKQEMATTNHSNRVTSTLTKEFHNRSIPLDYTCRANTSRVPCKLNDSAHCEAEGYGSSTHSSDSIGENSSNEKSQNDFAWLAVLVVPIIIAVVLVIVYCRRRCTDNNLRNEENQGEGIALNENHGSGNAPEER